MSNVHFSSKTDLWSTPQDFFDELNKRYQFDVDVCATTENAKVDTYFTKEINGLEQDWSKYKMCWMNPPYGREIGKWIEKAYSEAQKGTTVIALLPARTDTRWFHNHIYMMYGVSVEFVKGRLKFGGSKNAAPFPSMIVKFEKNIFKNL